MQAAIEVSHETASPMQGYQTCKYLLVFASILLKYLPKFASILQMLANLQTQIDCELLSKTLRKQQSAL